MGERKCLYFSRFDPAADRGAGGGVRRLIQFMETFARLNFEVISAAKEVRLSELHLNRFYSEALRRIKERFLTHSDYRSWSEHRRDAVYRLWRISRKWTSLIERMQDLKLVIVDDPIYFIPLVKKLKKYGIPIVAMCHNLETLVPCLVDQARQRIIFNKELDILSLCNFVITISREETLLLNNLNINAIFFPYFPVKKILNRMLDVRNMRRNTEKKGFLLMGTASNILTRNGMVKAIHEWRRHKLGLFGDKLLVAGYGTDVFLKKVACDHEIEFLGPLTNEELDQILSSVRACLCYQEGGGGALTRICEMLIGGVPVLANSQAARSYHNVDGLIEFSSFDELKQAIAKIFRFPLHRTHLPCHLN